MAIRKVYFYHIHAGVDVAGRPRPLRTERIFAAVDALPFTEQGRYLSDGDGNYTCCWVDKLPAPVHLALGTIRRANLPQLERAGALGPLPIPPDSGIVEQTHFVFFPTGIIGCLFNFYGPRASKLRLYMHEKAEALMPERVRFEMLLREDVLDQLDRMNRVRVVELSLTRAFIDTIREADESLGAAFGAAADAADAEHIELVLKPRKHSREWLGGRVLPLLGRLARRENLREEVTKFKVKGLNAETERLEQIDLLRDQFVVSVEVEVLEGRVRAVVPESAYQGIHRAYNQIRDQLLSAARVR